MFATRGGVNRLMVDPENLRNLAMAMSLRFEFSGGRLAFFEREPDVAAESVFHPRLHGEI